MRDFAVICIVHNFYNPHTIYQLLHTETQEWHLPGGLVQDNESLSDACIRILMDDMQIIAEQDKLSYVDEYVVDGVTTTVFRISRYTTVCDAYTLGLSKTYNQYQKIWFSSQYNMPHSTDVYKHKEIIDNYAKRMADDREFCFDIMLGIKDIICIGKATPAPKHQFEYKVTANFYSGDGDAPTQETTYVPTCNKEAMIKHWHAVTQICESSIIHDPVSAWPAWAQAYYYNYDYGTWISDVFTDGDYAAHFDGLEVTYFDGNGIEHDCKVMR